MAGFIGERARRRRRNSILSFIVIIVIIIGIYFYYNISSEYIIPSNTLLPSDQEIQSPEISKTAEELELKIYDKEQKIIFRDKQIDKFKNQIEILITENSKLVESVHSLNKQIKTITSENNDKTSEKIKLANAKILNLQLDSEKRIKKLNEEIATILMDKNQINDQQSKLVNENSLLKKEYKSLLRQNIKFKDNVTELQKLIENQKAIIKKQNITIEDLRDKIHP